LRPCLDRLQLRSSRGSPASSRICHTVCAEIGVPCSASTAAISPTLRPPARSASTFSRTAAVALRGPFGPGLASVNGASLPVRSRVAI
jgi:hypothetical protein